MIRCESHHSLWRQWFSSGRGSVENLNLRSIHVYRLYICRSITDGVVHWSFRWRHLRYSPLLMSVQQRDVNILAQRIVNFETHEEIKRAKLDNAKAKGKTYFQNRPGNMSSNLVKRWHVENFRDWSPTILVRNHFKDIFWKVEGVPYW